LVAELSPLWVGGVALLCLLVVYLGKPAFALVSERAPAWALYLTLGTLFPLLVAAVVLIKRAGRGFPAWLGILLTALPIVAAAIVAGPRHSLLALTAGLMSRFTAGHGERRQTGRTGMSSPLP
jgi:uncharacterized membrane protein YhdT